MPIYEYYCLDCRKVFEALRPLSQSDEPMRCRECEGAQTRRTLSLVAAQIVHGDDRYQSVSGSGCGCGGACACGHGHH